MGLKKDCSNFEIHQIMPPKKLKFVSRIDKLPYLLGMHIIEVPADVVKKAGGPGKKRFICTVNQKVSYPCGLIALRTGMAYISINKSRVAALKLKLGDAVDVELVPDESEFGMPVPEELQELLMQDPEGEERFRALTPGKQRNIIYYVSGVKSSQLRIDRALKLIGNLKLLPRGEENMRELLYGPGG